MNLKDFLTSKESQPELYWSLVIEKGWVQAGIWFIGDTTAESLSVSTGAVWSTDEELLEASDAALSSAIQKLPEDYPEPQKTVFGVAASWVKDGEIAEEYLTKIKKLCTELSLTPVGFVVLPEAIAHLYKSEEGTPLSAIVLKSGEETLEMSVFKLGSLVGSTEVARSVSLVEDVTEGLSRFDGASPLPSRFIVYDGKEGDLEDVKQTLLQATWGGNEKTNFLHTPQVEILDSDRKVLATSLAGAAEIGDVSTVIQKEEDNDSQELEPEPGKEPEPEPNTTPSMESEDAKDFGFEVGQDVSLNKEDIQNVTEVDIPPQVTVPVVAPSIAPTPVSTPSPIKTAGDYLAKSKKLFHSFSERLFPKKEAGMKQKNNKLTTILIILGVGVIGLILFWWFFQKAKVVVFVTPKRFEEQSQVTFNSNGEFDIAVGSIPAKVITDKVNGEKVKATSGTKLIGNKATGNIQIANGNSNSITLASGTVLTSSSGFKFVTNSSASISGQILPGSPGTSSIDVVAGDIGAQYNLAKGEIFTIGNYSKALVAGTSTNDFSGGSSQEVSAVSTEDQSNLLEELKTELTQNTKGSILAKVTPDQIFVSDLAGMEVSTQDFDHKVGDSVDSIKLSLEISSTGIAADREKLLEYAKNILKDKTPSGYSLKDDQIDFKFTFVNTTDGKYLYDVTVGANYLPQIDTQKTISLIAGKTPTVVKDYFRSIPGFDHAEVNLKINFPGSFGNLPRVRKNITIELRTEQ